MSTATSHEREFLRTCLCSHGKTERNAEEASKSKEQTAIASD